MNLVAPVLQQFEDNVLRFLTTSGQVQAKPTQRGTTLIPSVSVSPSVCVCVFVCVCVRVCLSLCVHASLLQALAGAVMPWVLVAQAVKAMAYPTNGALMGALVTWPAIFPQYARASCLVRALTLSLSLSLSLSLALSLSLSLSLSVSMYVHVCIYCMYIFKLHVVPHLVA